MYGVPFYLNLFDCKMPRFYEEEELRGALVVDSEGLIYGNVSRISVEEDGVKLHVSVRVRAEVEEVDIGRLRELLKDKIPEGAEDKELISLARSLGLELPKKKVEKELQHEKGVVPVEQIACIAEGDDIKVVVLSTPREAKYRGITERNPEYADLARIEGKMVVSMSGEVLGEAIGVVISAGRPGIRVKRLAAKRTINWLRFLRDLRKERRNAALRLEAKLDPYKNPKVPIDELEKLVLLLKEEGVDPSLLDNYTEEPEKRYYVDVPWDDVQKVGDVVLLRAKFA
ncbi:MAG: hypothetical protein DRO05_00015 [Thermoproteota archaeon]|nr:MAG: hypothetical protein DRO05_00015 [Candidatus Korarchaeota archaeon]